MSIRFDQKVLFSGSRKTVKTVKLLGASLSDFSRQPVPTTRNRRSKKPWTTSRYKITWYTYFQTCRLKEWFQR